MSGGVFQRSVYETTAGAFHNVKIQPETLALVIGANTNTAGVNGATPISRGSAKVSGSRRSLGIHTRMARIQFGSGATDAPTGYKPGGTIAIPILRPAMFNALAVGQTGTYLTKAVTVVGLTPEIIK